MSGPRLFGIETEYPLIFRDPQGRRLDESMALGKYFEVAREILPHVVDATSYGLFLQNGARFYPDCGKGEFATPETTTYWDTCRYVKAGELILEEVKAAMAQQPDIGGGSIMRCNVCYGPQPTTWARHLSVSHHVVPEKLPDHLIPHLVSQVIYTGAGGFNNRSAGIEFMISPRVEHLDVDVSPESTGSRGIFHTKNEPLCVGSNRLHVLTGESLCSETSTCLSVAMTVLVVALIEAGGKPGHTVRLKSPLAAIKRFATDVSLTAHVLDVNRKAWTALDIQRHYLSEIESRLDHPAMPSWGSIACRMCRDILDHLEEGHRRVAQSLDWAIKYPIYTRWIEKRGFSWESIKRWNKILDRLVRVVNRADASRKVHRITLDDVPMAKAALPKRSFPLSRLGVADFSWDELEQILRLQQELFEMDACFGELGDRGIFNQLDRDGVLDHHVEQVEHIETATTDPPAEGRARLRGEVIRRVQPDRQEYTGDWSFIDHPAGNRRLDLSDPHTATENWCHAPEPRPTTRGSRLRQMRRLATARNPYDEAQSCYDRGDFEQAYRLVLPLVPNEGDEGYSDDDAGHDGSRRLYAWIQARRGFLDGAQKLNAISRRYDRPPRFLVSDYLFVYRFGGGLRPCIEMDEWIRIEEQADAAASSERPNETCEHRATWLLQQNRFDEARHLLESVIGAPTQINLAERYTGRGLAALSEAYRRMGDTAAAQQKVEESLRVLSASERRGDYADFALTQSARLAPDSSGATEFLREASRIQREFGNVVGETRTLLLGARIGARVGRSSTLRDRILALQSQRPAVQNCPLLKEILSHWNEWTSGAHSPSGADERFWGL